MSGAFSSSSGQMCLSYARYVYSKDSSPATATTTITTNEAANYATTTKVVSASSNIMAGNRWEMISRPLMNLVVGKEYVVSKNLNESAQKSKINTVLSS